jgi:hypothetical protein
VSAFSRRVLLALLLLGCRANTPTPTPEPVFFPDPPDPPRVQFLRAVGSSSDFQSELSAFDRLVLGSKAAGEPIVTPYGVAVHSGKVFVCDLGRSDVLEIDFATGSLTGLSPGGRAKLRQPVNLAFAPDGTLYIADLERRQVVVLDPDRRYRAEFGPFGDESRPVDVDLRGDELFVTDAGAHCVRVLDRTSGAELRSFGSDATCTLRGPTNLALDAVGQAFVTDTIDCRVCVFDAQGAFQRAIGQPGSSIGSFARPKGIATFEDQLFVIDSAFENCQVFSASGAPLMFFGGPGGARGACYLPAGIWVGTEGLEFFRSEFDHDFEPTALIAVTNFYGSQRVSFYALGRSRRFRYEN